MDATLLAKAYEEEVLRNTDKIIYMIGEIVAKDVESYCAYIREKPERMVLTPCDELQKEYLSIYLKKNDLPCESEAEAMYRYLDDVFDRITDEVFRNKYVQMLKEDEDED